MRKFDRFLPILMLGATLNFAACDQADVPTNGLTDDAETSEFALAKPGDVIPGQYIVVLKDESEFNAEDGLAGKTTRAVLDDMTSGSGVESMYRYESSVHGFAGAFTAEAINRIRSHPAVAYIENDRVVALPPFTIQGLCDKNPNHHKCGDPEPDPDPEPEPDPTQVTPWGITRVNGGSSYTGSGVAWILDTGIDAGHPDLEVDASRGWTAFTRGRDSSTDDKNGHGTHVAGTIAALDNGFGVVGVAAGATVIPVKVLDGNGSGSYSGVIAGVDFVAANGSSGDVANMSLTGPEYALLDDAVKAAALSGIRFSLAAGNEDVDASFSSPARTNGTNVYTISAMDSGDNFAWFSNWGAPVDYAAPGVSVESTWKGGGFNTISGTSMAAPHVAGILLLGNVGQGGFVKGDPDGDADPIAIH